MERIPKPRRTSLREQRSGLPFMKAVRRARLAVTSPTAEARAQVDAGRVLLQNPAGRVLAIAAWAESHRRLRAGWTVVQADPDFDGIEWRWRWHDDASGQCPADGTTVGGAVASDASLHTDRFDAALARAAGRGGSFDDLWRDWCGDADFVLGWLMPWAPRGETWEVLLETALAATSEWLATGQLDAETTAAGFACFACLEVTKVHALGEGVDLLGTDAPLADEIAATRSRLIDLARGHATDHRAAAIVGALIGKSGKQTVRISKGEPKRRA